MEKDRLVKISGGILALSLLTSGCGVPTASGGHESTSSTANPTATLKTPDATILPTQTPDNNPINKVPLAEITKKQGLSSMVAVNYPVSKEWPYGYSVSLQQGTIVALEKDAETNSVWMALAFPGEKTTKEDEGQSATNLDRTKTELYIYKGFTAWVELNDYVIVVGTDNMGQQGLKYATKFLKVGEVMNLCSVSINQPPAHASYTQTNLSGISELNNSVGLPNNRTDRKIKLIGETILVNGIVK